jgi:TorA maturation chaperone TorD
MRDHGLEEAIRAAGGVSELARHLGISQPSVSNWTRIPAERVISIESLTKVPRSVLRPDLYGDQATARELDDVDTARAREYALLAALLMRAPNADFLSRLSGLRGDASPIGVAHIDLAQAANDIDVTRVEREFFNLFIGVGRSELLPYGSYYLTGFLHERPLARLREDLAAFGIERRQGQAEPEDHAGILCEIMSGLIDGRLPAGSEQQIFQKHLAPWIGRFFADLERAEGADFYRRVGTLGRVFVEIETEAFSLAA